jgi:hypothetical protein
MSKFDNNNCNQLINFGFNFFACCNSVIVSQDQKDVSITAKEKVVKRHFIEEAIH